MAVNNEQISREVLAAVGGRENITSVAHCMTRLRFTLKDNSLPNQEEIKKIKGVLGVQISGGQFQVIIGQNVSKVYAILCDISGVAAQKSVDENLDQPKEKLTVKSALSKVMSTLSGSITPLIPIMLVAGMFKMIVAVFGPDMLGVMSAESDLYTLFTFVGDAGFYFMPVFLGYTSAKKMGATPVLGMLLGAILIHPTFVAMAGGEVTFSIYGISTTPASYASTVLPIILTSAVLVWVEKLFKKIIPSVLSTIFVPFLSVLVMIPVMFLVCAPIGGWIGTAFCTALLTLGNIPVVGIIVIALIGGLWEFLVMTGMHQVMITNMIIIFAENGFDGTISLGAVAASMAVAGMLLGAFLRLRDKDEKSLNLSYFVSSLIGGVTEPGLYGTGLKFKTPFIGMFAGGFAGALYAAITGVKAYAMVPVANFLALSAYTGGSTANLINGVISGVIAIVVAAIVTYLVLDPNAASAEEA